MQIDRSSVFSTVRQSGPVAAIELCRTLGYRRASTPNRQAIIITPDRADWVFLPSFTISQADKVFTAYGKLPTL